MAACATKYRGLESSIRLEDTRATQDVVMAQPRPAAGPCAKPNAGKDKAPRHDFLRGREFKPDLRAVVGGGEAIVSKPRRAGAGRTGGAGRNFRRFFAF